MMVPRRILSCVVLTVLINLGFAQQTTATADVLLTTSSVHPALVPTKRCLPGDRFTRLHESFLRRRTEGPIGVVFMGDSITERWTSAPEVWAQHFGKYDPANFGVSGDRTQHVLWRIENGELDGIHPKALVLMIGTNNSNSDTSEPIVQAITKIVGATRAKLPDTKILLLGIFPRGDKNDNLDNKAMATIREVNPEIAKLADGQKVFYLDIGGSFIVQGKIPREFMPDQLHLSPRGYQVWAEAIDAQLSELMK